MQACLSLHLNHFLLPFLPNEVFSFLNFHKALLFDCNYKTNTPRPQFWVHFSYLPLLPLPLVRERDWRSYFWNILGRNQRDPLKLFFKYLIWIKGLVDKNKNMRSMVFGGKKGEWNHLIWMDALFMWPYHYVTLLGILGKVCLSLLIYIYKAFPKFLSQSALEF